MQVGIDVTCMHASFGGRGPSGFGDMATFQKWPNFPFGAWTIVHSHIYCFVTLIYYYLEVISFLVECDILHAYKFMPVYILCSMRLLCADR